MRYIFPVTLLLFCTQSTNAQVQTSHLYVVQPEGTFATEFQTKTLAPGTEFDQLTITIYENHYTSWQLSQSQLLKSQLDIQWHTMPIEIFTQLHSKDIQVFENQLYLFTKNEADLDKLKKEFKYYLQLHLYLQSNPNYLNTDYPHQPSQG
jgi:hypothetical protein